MTIRRGYFIPIVLALLSLAGLVFALLDDGVWDAIASLMLGVPVAVCLAMLGRSYQRAKSSQRSERNG